MEIGRLGDWEIGRLRDWEIGISENYMMDGNVHDFSYFNFLYLIRWGPISPRRFFLFSSYSE